jgi:toxin ParE1/3/4
MKKLVVAEAARADLRGIETYTKQEWGADRSAQYLGAFRQAFARLRARSSLGPPRADLGAEYRSILCGRHVIFYRDLADHVEIVRVLHTSMDVHRHLDPRGEER